MGCQGQIRGMRGGFGMSGVASGGRAKFGVAGMNLGCWGGQLWGARAENGMSEFGFGVSGFGYGVSGGFGVSGPNLGCQGLTLVCEGRIWDVGAGVGGVRSGSGEPGGLWHFRADFGVRGRPLGRIERGPGSPRLPRLSPVTRTRRCRGYGGRRGHKMAAAAAPPPALTGPPSRDPGGL